MFPYRNAQKRRDPVDKMHAREYDTCYESYANDFPDFACDRIEEAKRDATDDLGDCPVCVLQIVQRSTSSPFSSNWVDFVIRFVLENVHEPESQLHQKHHEDQRKLCNLVMNFCRGVGRRKWDVRSLVLCEGCSIAHMNGYFGRVLEQTP